MVTIEKPTMEFLEQEAIKANDLYTIKRTERKRIELAISLNICPDCGNELITEELEILDHPKSYLFGLIVIKTKLWDYRKVCVFDKYHYEDKGYYCND